MLKYRTISGICILAVIFLSAFFMPVFGIWLMLIAISSLGQLEFYRMVESAGLPCFRVVGLVSGALMISATFFTMIGEGVNVLQSYNWDNFVLLLSLVAIFVRQFPQKYNDKPLETIACTLMGIWYVPYLFNYFTRLAFMWGDTQSLSRVSTTGRSVCLFAIVVVKCSDIGAYLVGRKFGRHKLFPRLSPKKTWEGLAGGVLFSLVASAVIYCLGDGHLGTVELTLRDVLILGVALPIVGVIGDIFESLIKRASGAKDSSAAIPGMGGVLDVLDSLLFTAPVVCVYAQVFWQ